jgi:pilus assembly protein Flp/PilA
MIKKLMNFIKDEEGVTMVEYALLLVLIAIVAIGAVTILGTNVSTTFQTAADAVGGAGS